MFLVIKVVDCFLFFTWTIRTGFDGRREMQTAMDLQVVVVFVAFGNKQHSIQQDERSFGNLVFS